VKESRLPQGGEGLFARRDIGKNEVVSLYNGIKIKSCTYASAHMARSDYRIRLNGDVDMDIPKGYHHLSQYSATLAHKANHSFKPNVEWKLYEHPR
jgi:SET domain-containing protein